MTSIGSYEFSSRQLGFGNYDGLGNRLFELHSTWGALWRTQNQSPQNTAKIHNSENCAPAQPTRCISSILPHCNFGTTQRGKKMTNRYSATASIVAAFLLSACGGTGTPAEEDPPTFSEINAEINADIDELEMDGFDLNDDVAKNMLPMAGSASYEGFIRADIASQDYNPGDFVDSPFPEFELDGRTIVGELALLVDFGLNNESVTGTVSDLLDSTNQAYTGTLDVATNTSFDRQDEDEPTFSAAMTGDVVGGGTTYTFAAALLGNFYDDPSSAATDTDIVAGEISGGLYTGSNDLKLGEQGQIQNTSLFGAGIP